MSVSGGTSSQVSSSSGDATPQPAKKLDLALDPWLDGHPDLEAWEETLAWLRTWNDVDGQGRIRCAECGAVLPGAHHNWCERRHNLEPDPQFVPSVIKEHGGNQVTACSGVWACRIKIGKVPAGSIPSAPAWERHFGRDRFAHDHRVANHKVAHEERDHVQDQVLLQ